MFVVKGDQVTKKILFKLDESFVLNSQLNPINLRSLTSVIEFPFVPQSHSACNNNNNKVVLVRVSLLVVNAFRQPLTSNPCTSLIPSIIKLFQQAHHQP